MLLAILLVVLMVIPTELCGVWSTVVSTPLCLLVDSGVCTRDHGVVWCDVLCVWTWYSTESPGEDVDLCMLLGVCTTDTPPKIHCSSWYTLVCCWRGVIHLWGIWRSMLSWGLGVLLVYVV